MRRARNDGSASRRRRMAMAGAAGLSLLAMSALALEWLDRRFPPPLGDALGRSVEVVDRDGTPLRVYVAADGRWRLPVDLGAVDPQYLRMVVAYEDKRFYEHSGVDALALLRAAGQLLANGRIVSGGSTLTMQLTRLAEASENPGQPRRSIAAKFRQIVRAVQIERRLTKDEILARYLTLAPYGGNIEGVRAAALAWFAKEPTRLTPAEAALLVALPQSPETRRPDRNRKTAEIARNRVAERLAAAGVLKKIEAADIRRATVPRARHAMPQMAAHLADTALDRDPGKLVHRTRLDARVQKALEDVAAISARRIGNKVSVAIVMADARSGDILASVGSAGYLDRERGGALDMTQALRSPGSVLKPFIYGLALEDGLVMPETLVDDRPADFAGYRPVNFDQSWQGDISVRRALQMSLNVPAVRLLDAVGVQRVLGRMKRVGIRPGFVGDRRPGLALALGGAGLTLTDLVQLYANLVSQRAVALGDGVRSQPGQLGGMPMLSPVATWHVTDILTGIGAPAGMPALPIAYKTGTSYGYRDAWSVGFDGRHVIGVWIGRPDNGAVPGISGGATATPVLFDAFAKSGVVFQPMPPPPAGAIKVAFEELPFALRRFERTGRGGIVLPDSRIADRLHIAFPGDGSIVEGLNGGATVVIKLQGGSPPFRLLADGRPAGDHSRRRQLIWTPEGPGAARLTVLDAEGQASAISLVLR